MTKFEKIIKQTGMSSPQFAKAFHIPYNTVSSWVRGERNPPEYVLELIEYKIEKEGIKMRYEIKIHDNSNHTAIVVYHYDEEANDIVTDGSCNIDHDTFEYYYADTDLFDTAEEASADAEEDIREKLEEALPMLDSDQIDNIVDKIMIDVNCTIDKAWC